MSLRLILHLRRGDSFCGGRSDPSFSICDRWFSDHRRIVNDLQVRDRGSSWRLLRFPNSRRSRKCPAICFGASDRNSGQRIFGNSSKSILAEETNG